DTLARPAEEQPPQELLKDFRHVGKLWLRRPSSCATHIAARSRPSGGSIRLLGAGRREGEWNQRYTQSVRDFDWADFYSQWAGAAYLDFFRDELSAEADIVLVDSRTSVTEHGGVCTHHLADLVILMSAANDLNLDGTLWMANVLVDERLLKM